MLSHICCTWMASSKRISICWNICTAIIMEEVLESSRESPLTCACLAWCDSSVVFDMKPCWHMQQRWRGSSCIMAMWPFNPVVVAKFLPHVSQSRRFGNTGARLRFATGVLVVGISADPSKVFSVPSMTLISENIDHWAVQYNNHHYYCYCYDYYCK